MKKLLICTILFLFWSTTGYAYTLNNLGSWGDNAYYDLYNHWYTGGQWVAMEGFAGPGQRGEAWSVTSDYSLSGQVWVAVFIEPQLTWTINNNEDLENLFFTGGYELNYWNGSNEQHTQSKAISTVDYGKTSGSLSLTFVQPLLVTLGEEYFSNIDMYIDMPTLSADPWIGEHYWSANSGSSIFVNLDSRISYLLPSEKPLPVPEPATFLLLGVGLVGFAGRLLLNKPMGNKK